MVFESTGAPPTGSVPAPRAAARVIAIANQKGGVGKTTTVVNLAAALAGREKSVVIVDLDPQANATTGIGVDFRSLDNTIYEVLIQDCAIEDTVVATSVRNLYCVPAKLDLAGAEVELVSMLARETRLREALKPIRDDYDFVLIDCPPSLGLLTINGLVAADELLVPIQCEYFALEGLGALIRNVELVRRTVNPGLRIAGFCLTMYDARTKLAAQVAEDVRDHFGDQVFSAMVPRSVRLSEAPSFGQPIEVYAPMSRGAIAYRDLAKEVIEHDA
ncbi:MAG: ParA family protein [Acidimicrobiia bacterium]|nr:ParA family protein [Acidimicrobiia bacterium]